ncbi:glycosyltransferase involved in cell wall biosynthesis [Sphingomonas sp. BK235]|nr:glycosyltransferase involved in cell wall biosynthesis [Sphingomonas sp. BK235]
MDAVRTPDEPTGALLLVIPAVATLADGRVRLDGDFANNLKGYLTAFATVTVMCPPVQSSYTFPSLIDPAELDGADRLRILLLPIPYREDRYLLKRGAVIRQLDAEIARADCILLSPHAPFDWSVLAADRCIRLHKPYNMEADWDGPAMWRFMLANMPRGLKRWRKRSSYWWFGRGYRRALTHSTIALLQGGDVYEGLAPLAPRPFMVLNVQVTREEHIDAPTLAEKIERVRAGAPLSLVYAGRADEIKGPLEWLETVARLRDAGLDFVATWAGDGPMLAQMRRFVAERDLGDRCRLLGTVSRPEARALIEQADLFLYCHMTRESPRCLVEALALGSPIVGFGSAYSRGLVAPHGGGRFVAIGDSAALATEVEALAHDRAALAQLIDDAARSGALLERDVAIAERIRLMKSYLGAV